ncbi:hypothetical protein [Streptococcus iniae]|uniref:hypothetical protein n=1 Tax=Streptococcus iniae TaxID=1346 RepID=UPI00374E0E76
MGILNRLFRKQESLLSPHQSRSDREKKEALSEWEKLPAYIPADPKDYPLVSLIATAIASGDKPDSQFTITNIWQPQSRGYRSFLDYCQPCR